MIRRPEGTDMMRRRTTALLIAALAAGLALGGCGRKGELEPPGAVAAEPVAALPTVFGTSPAEPPPEEPERPDSPFPLDFLI